MKKNLLLFVFTFSLLTLAAQESRKPLIGISCTFADSAHSSVRITYSESVRKAGGIPVLIPVTESEKDLRDVVSLLDGLILSGGEDLNPAYYNESPVPEIGEVVAVRDVYDLCLIRLAMERSIPLFGICRGLQAINVAFGGTLYQDIPAQHHDASVNHRQDKPSRVPTHRITLLPSSVIANVTGQTELLTNTFHHQAVKEIAPGFRVTAWAADSIPEAIESVTGRPVWGVQFHPEAQTVAGDSIMFTLFEFLVQQAEAYRQGRK